MVRYQVTLSYDGTDFAGYQRQAKRRTVQGEVEKALIKLGWTATSILAAGRTDTGVHASGQVITFDLEWRHSSQQLVYALNANLPGDISVKDAREVEATFHPRYDARSREYYYRLLQETTRNPLEERFSWRLQQKVDISVLASCAAAIVGEYDYAAYGTPPRPGSSTIRQVTRSEWQLDGNRMMYIIRGNAFLYHMVRRLVFLQVEAATGKIEWSSWLRNFEAGVPEHPGIAPAKGLELAEVRYDDGSGKPIK